MVRTKAQSGRRAPRHNLWRRAIWLLGQSPRANGIISTVDSPLNWKRYVSACARMASCRSLARSSSR